MPKVTISAEHAAKYPSLEKRVGETVDASVLQRAISDAGEEARDGKKKEKAPADTSSAPAPAATKRVRKSVSKKK